MKNPFDQPYTVPSTLPDHYEGRSYLGFHHHCAIVTAAHGFLTLERQNPNRQRPA